MEGTCLGQYGAQCMHRARGVIPPRGAVKPTRNLTACTGEQDMLPASQAAAAAAVTALKAGAGPGAPAPHASRVSELDRRAGELASALAREQSARCA